MPQVFIKDIMNNFLPTNFQTEKMEKFIEKLLHSLNYKEIHNKVI